MMRGLLPLCPVVTMYAAALDRKKHFMPAVPQRGHKSRVLRIGNDFHGSV